MDIVYLVKGYITKSSTEKSYLYNGTSAIKAFEVFNRFGNAAKAELSIFEDGKLIYFMERKENEAKIKNKWLITDTVLGNKVTVETTIEDAMKEFENFIDDILDSSYVDSDFKSTVLLLEIKNNDVRLLNSREVIYKD